MKTLKFEVIEQTETSHATTRWLILILEVTHAEHSLVRRDGRIERILAHEKLSRNISKKISRLGGALYFKNMITAALIHGSATGFIFEHKDRFNFISRLNF